MKNFGKFIAGLILLIVLTIVTGFVLSKLWVLFVASTFGLPVLSIPQAIGLSLIFGYLRYKKPDDSDKFEFTKLLGDVLSSIITAFLILGIAYVVASFI